MSVCPIRCTRRAPQDLRCEDTDQDKGCSIPTCHGRTVYADEYSSIEKHGRKRISNNEPQYMMEALQDGLSWADAIRHATHRAGEELFKDTYYKR